MKRRATVEGIEGVALFAWIALAIALLMSNPDIPQCQEDQVLVGIHQFENGRYTAYECGPAVDDFNASR